MTDRVAAEATEAGVGSMVEVGCVVAVVVEPEVEVLEVAAAEAS